LTLGSLIAIFYLVWNIYRLRIYSLNLEFALLDSVFKNASHSITPQPKIAFCKEAEVPFTYGWFQTRIILPESLRNQEQKLIIAIKHELTHIKRRDFLINNLAALV